MPLCDSILAFTSTERPLKVEISAAQVRAEKVVGMGSGRVAIGACQAQSRLAAEVQAEAQKCAELREELAARLWRGKNG